MSCGQAGGGALPLFDRPSSPFGSTSPFARDGANGRRDDYWGVHTLLTQTDPPGHWVQAEVHSAPVVLVSAAQLLFGHRWKFVLQA